MRNQHGHTVKLWFITFVLSHSRYKYVWWLDRPFTTGDVVEAHEQAFAFYGGIPEEIVYDQDHLLLTSENNGDLLTHEFGKYIEQRKFSIYMCRKQDPESKGRIENVVKYVKQNFARHRPFTNVDKLNEECLAWLNRTGNAMVHHTTKKIPAEVYALEKEHLQPVHKKIQKLGNSSITRTVRKDNTIWYEGNRYTVPIGTYDGTDKEVSIRVQNETELIIYEEDTGEILAEHKLCLHQKGQLVQNQTMVGINPKAYKHIWIMSPNSSLTLSKHGIISLKFERGNHATFVISYRRFKRRLRERVPKQPIRHCTTV